jgi:hypothetical protein
MKQYKVTAGSGLNEVQASSASSSSERLDKITIL